MRILVDSFADAGLPNAQMGNAREIVCRLDPERFHVSMFAVGPPDPRIRARKNTRLIQLGARRQTLKILREFMWGNHDLLFYLKASPASRWYLSLRKNWNDVRTTVGTMESQSDFRNEPSLSAEAIRLWEQTVLRCDYLFSNSAAVRKNLERQYGKRSEIIPTGVDTTYFTPDWDRSQNPRPRVLFAGSLLAFKQPQLLLDAAAQFPATDFRIAGDGPLASPLRERIARDDLKNVSLLGLLSAEQLRDEYRAADIFFFPSCWEGSPKVILEAAACGAPVVIRNNYSAETVVHGETGLQAASDGELFAYLKLLLENRELRMELGRKGRKHSEKYEWNLIAAQWEQAFVGVVQQQGSRIAS
jgi:glycosyltransferase involved in cell wall biosynthesis